MSNADSHESFTANRKQSSFFFFASSACSLQVCYSLKVTSLCMLRCNMFKGSLKIWQSITD